MQKPSTYAIPIEPKHFSPPSRGGEEKILTSTGKEVRQSELNICGTEGTEDCGVQDPHGGD